MNRISFIVAAALTCGSAQASDCDALAAKVGQATGSTVLSVEQSHMVPMSHPGTSELTLLCPDNASAKNPDLRTSLSVFSNDSHLQQGFYDVVGSFGAMMSNASAKSLVSQAQACMRDAYSAGSEVERHPASTLTMRCSGGATSDVPYHIAIEKAP